MSHLNMPLPQTHSSGTYRLREESFPEVNTHRGERSQEQQHPDTQEHCLETDEQGLGTHDKDKGAGVMAVVLPLSILSPDKGHFLTLISKSTASGLQRDHGSRGQNSPEMFPTLSEAEL